MRDYVKFDGRFYLFFTYTKATKATKATKDTMMDYYGSIVKENAEIDRELINYFTKNTRHRDLPRDIFQKLICDLRETHIIKEAYSITGWMMYGGQEAIVNLTKSLVKREEDHRKLAIKRVMFAHCMKHKPLCADLVQKVGEAMI